MKHIMGEPDSYGRCVCTCGEVFLTQHRAKITHCYRLNSKEHCKECNFWVVFRTNKYDRDIYGCRLGKKPENRNYEPYCQWFQAKEEVNNDKVMAYD